jgi:hypothetical protein
LLSGALSCLQDKNRTPRLTSMQVKKGGSTTRMGGILGDKILELCN